MHQLIINKKFKMDHVTNSLLNKRYYYMFLITSTTPNDPFKLIFLLNSNFILLQIIDSERSLRRMMNLHWTVTA